MHKDLIVKTVQDLVWEDANLHVETPAKEIAQEIAQEVLLMALLMAKLQDVLLVEVA